MHRHMHHPNCGCGCKRPAVQGIAENQYVQGMAENQYVQGIAENQYVQPVALQHHMQPIVCPPLCRYTDSYVKREVPYIQPLININRQHIVDVPVTQYEEINQNVIVSPYEDQGPFDGRGRGRGRNRYPRC